MVVLGRSGLLIDNCPVFPSSSSLKSKDAGHTTIPMPNNTEIVVHNKRFVFMYPPKELRPALALQAQATSAQTPKRKLRMSMIRSAEVFSPAPSHDPMVNLKILQSPVKGRLSTSPVKQGKPNESEEIVLVHGDCPRVVEEERDLVILEDIAALPVTAGTAQGSPQTPVRRQPRPSLHRAVLIRSAQRTVMRMEEEEEEKEVEASVSQVPSASSSDAENDNDSSEDEGDRMEGVERSDKSIGLIKKMSGLRKSLEAVTGFGWPFRSGSAQPEEDEGDEEEEEEEEGEAMDVCALFNSLLDPADQCSHRSIPSTGIVALKITVTTKARPMPPRLVPLRVTTTMRSICKHPRAAAVLPPSLSLRSGRQPWGHS
jgi:hypothetical protein